ncbi:GNAT family N-acetyltransferase [Microbacterium sp. C5A9]|uniref:GNAT family N-acetyltransferase n=1 Tax=Microbacterium sp. C5A9 TaxID=2736663 RepID=UPI001F52140C|nr:GNAT family N-acetyltransferase [Microbacterium sp. C5A9]MCI1017198.1 GNAT family N-acetyltransferase [Microbacterium sp. C5A9]
MQLTPVDGHRFDTWREQTRARLIALRQESGILRGEDAVVDAEAFLDQLLPEGRDTETSSIVRIIDRGREIGTLWMVAAGGILHLVDLAIDDVPERRVADDLFQAITTMARRNGVERLSISLHSTDAAGLSFVEGRGFRCASIRMLLEPLPDRLSSPPGAVSQDSAAQARGGSVELHPMTGERFETFAAASEAAFSADLVASGRYSEHDARVESARQMALELPDGLDSAGQELFTAQVDGAEVGVLWIGMRVRDGRPHAFILDIEVADGHRRRGYGRGIMLAAEEEARRLGADSIGLHVFGFNEQAIRLYEGLGYRRVEERFLLDIDGDDIGGHPRE